MANNRLSDTILNTGKGFAKSSSAPMVNLAHGGQWGAMTNPGTYMNNGQYVRTNVIARLIQAPRGFQLLDNSEIWVENLRAFVETHSRTIDGLQWGLTVDSAEQAFGAAGEMQSTPTKVSRSKSEVSHTADEKYGMPIWHLHDGWIRNLIQDPETMFPAIVARGKDNTPTDMLPDFYSMTVLYFEPDPTFQFPTKSWLMTNMYPKELPSAEGRKDMTSAYEPLEIAIPYTGIQTVGKGVAALAQQFMDSFNRGGMNTSLRPAFLSGLDADVKAVGAGYAEDLADAAKIAIRG